LVNVCKKDHVVQHKKDLEGVAVLLVVLWKEAGSKAGGGHSHTHAHTQPTTPQTHNESMALFLMEGLKHLGMA
jgi:hypothetical protein